MAKEQPTTYPRSETQLTIKHTLRVIECSQYETQDEKTIFQSTTQNSRMANKSNKQSNTIFKTN